MVAATLEGALSDLGRARVRPGLLPGREVEVNQSRTRIARVGFIEKIILGKKLLQTEIPEKRVPQDSRMKLALSRNRAIDAARQAQRERIRDLWQSGLLKVRQGVTSLEEVEACTSE